MSYERLEVQRGVFRNIDGPCTVSVKPGQLIGLDWSGNVYIDGERVTGVWFSGDITAEGDDDEAHF